MSKKPFVKILNDERKKILLRITYERRMFHDYFQWMYRLADFICLKEVSREDGRKG